MIENGLQSLDCWTVSVPLPTKIRLGDVDVQSREFVFVRVTAADGSEGTSYAMTRNAPVASVLAGMVWPHVAGLSLSDIPSIRAALDRGLVTHGASGILQRAISALDIALWDAQGVLSGQPLWQMLGGDAATSTQLMIVADYLRAGESLTQYARRVAEYARSGYRAIKLYPPEKLEDLAPLVRAVRDALPPAARATRLIVDMAWLWRSAAEAVEHVRSWDPLELGWIEDPLPADRIDALRELSAQTRTPIAAGDELSIPVVAAELINSRAVDVLRLDCTTIGGITTATELLQSARHSNLPVSLHAYPEIHRHLAGAFPDVVTLVERFPENSAYWGIDNFVSTATPIRPIGAVQGAPLGHGPGLGLEIDWDRVVASSVEHCHRSLVGTQ